MQVEWEMCIFDDPAHIDIILLASSPQGHCFPPESLEHRALVLTLPSSHCSGRKPVAEQVDCINLSHEGKEPAKASHQGYSAMSYLRLLINLALTSL